MNTQDHSRELPQPSLHVNPALKADSLAHGCSGDGGIFSSALFYQFIRFVPVTLQIGLKVILVLSCTSDMCFFFSPPTLWPSSISHFYPWPLGLLTLELYWVTRGSGWNLPAMEPPPFQQQATSSLTRHSTCRPQLSLCSLCGLKGSICYMQVYGVGQQGKG